ncbi:transposase [Streptomyces sp. SID486]|nr:transposase [Streptomyces sp. SID486]
MPDRLCLQGILFVLYNDIPWQLLPPELGFGSGQTCWRRLDRWQQAGVFDRLHRVLLAELNAAGGLDWSRAAWMALTSAGKGGADTGPSPVDRRKTGSKHHLIRDGRGTPSKVITTAANANDVTQTLALVDGIPPVAGRPGRPRRDLNPRSVTRATTPTPTATCCGTDLLQTFQEDTSVIVLRALTRLAIVLMAVISDGSSSGAVVQLVRAVPLLWVAVR